jgi:hypothetical protein
VGLEEEINQDRCFIVSPYRKVPDDEEDGDGAGERRKGCRGPAAAAAAAFLEKRAFSFILQSVLQFTHTDTRLLVIEGKALFPDSWISFTALGIVVMLPMYGNWPD